MPPHQKRPLKRPGGPPPQGSPHTPPQQERRRICPACKEELNSAEDLVEIEVRKRGKATGKKLKICKTCNKHTVAVLALIEPDFPEELHIYTDQLP